MNKNNEIKWQISNDGSIIGRKKFGNGTIGMQRLQFSSNLGIAFCVNAGRVPQAIIYE